MREETGRAILKWSLAILLLAGLSLYAIQNVDDAFRAGVAFGGEEASDAAAPALAGPVTDGEATPQIDFAFVANSVSALTSDGMTVGPGAQDGVLLSFPLIPGSPNCVQTALLELTVRSATPTEFGVYPSTLQDLETLAETTPVAEPNIPLAEPVRAFTDGTPGPLSWDVLTLYQTYAAGESFDGVAAPEVGSPFSVVVRPTDQGAAGRQVVFASSESPDSRPRLIWTGIPGCQG